MIHCYNKRKFSSATISSFIEKPGSMYCLDSCPYLVKCPCFIVPVQFPRSLSHLVQLRVLDWSWKEYFFHKVSGNFKIGPCLKYAGVKLALSLDHFCHLKLVSRSQCHHNFCHLKVSIHLDLQGLQLNVTTFTPFIPS